MPKIHACNRRRRVTSTVRKLRQVCTKQPSKKVKESTLVLRCVYMSTPSAVVTCSASSACSRRQPSSYAGCTCSPEGLWSLALRVLAVRALDARNDCCDFADLIRWDMVLLRETLSNLPRVLAYHPV